MSKDVTDEEQDDDGLTIISGDDDDDGEPVAALFEEGQRCGVCQRETGRVGLDPSCRGAYDGEPVFACYGCLETALRGAWENVDGTVIVVEPFDTYAALAYYRIDELPAYQFVREDIEALSWLLLTIGDDCVRCGQQSHAAWLTKKFVDPDLPEDEPLFRGLDREIAHLCGNCAASALAEACRRRDLPVMSVELPRSAMGVLMPTGD